MKRTKIGNKANIVKEIELLTEYEKQLNKVASLAPGQLRPWFDSHFASLPEGVREGLFTITEVVYAQAKVTKRLWLNK